MRDFVQVDILKPILLAAWRRRLPERWLLESLRLIVLPCRRLPAAWLLPAAPEFLMA